MAYPSEEFPRIPGVTEAHMLAENATLRHKLDSEHRKWAANERELRAEADRLRKSKRDILERLAGEKLAHDLNLQALEGKLADCRTVADHALACLRDLPFVVTNAESTVEPEMTYADWGDHVECVMDRCRAALGEPGEEAGPAPPPPREPRDGPA